MAALPGQVLPRLHARQVELKTLQRVFDEPISHPSTEPLKSRFEPA
jgi:hypothetical protein